MTFHAVLEVLYTFLDMLGSNIFLRMLMAAVTGVLVIVVVLVAGIATGFHMKPERGWGEGREGGGAKGTSRGARSRGGGGRTGRRTWPLAANASGWAS